MQELKITEMTIAHYGSMIDLWERTEGLVLSEADSEANIESFLRRNAGLSFVATQDGKVAGTSLCGHDGRRGFLYHVAVDPAVRGKGVAGRMVALSLAGLQAAGIEKCHLFTLEDNEIGNRYWANNGWQRRSGILLYTRDVP
ncbi:GNAT family N-acetyltransferase [Paenibacillus hodogayensis]|uniref:GNAT family N-acetyltransferase n=1 Tax=Paenibacillus hodogayensis TaxID=279208 RepID=A0ABV5W3N2_9BACL